MDSPILVQPEASRKPSIAERRPLFVSVDGAPTLLLTSVGGSDREGTVSLERNHVPPLTDLASTLTLASEDRAQSTAHRNRVGGMLRSSVVSMKALQQSYKQLLAPYTTEVATPQHISSQLRLLNVDGIVAHCLQLHAMIQDCLGSTTNNAASALQQPSILHEVSSTSLHATVSQPFSSISFDLASPEAGGIAATSSLAIPASVRRGDLLAVTPAHLHHSMSMMSATYDPVRTTVEARKSIDDDGSKMINDYVVLDDIGRGSFGKVKLAFDTALCRMVAIKIIRKPSTWGTSTVSSATQNSYEMEMDLDSSMNPRRQASSKVGTHKIAMVEALQREIAVMKKLRHKNIVALYEVIDDPDAEKLYIVMQYVNNGALGKLSADKTCEAIASIRLLRIAVQLLSGLQYLHSRGVVHRDIKPENILVNTDDEAFLADFGVSEYFDCSATVNGVDSLASTVVVGGQRGTKLFMSPELLRLSWGPVDDTNSLDGSLASGSQTVKGRAVDMWALGVTLYTLLVGRAPYSTPDDIMNAAVMPQQYDAVPLLWKPLLDGLLHRDPAERWTAAHARQHVKGLLHTLPTDDCLDIELSAPNPNSSGGITGSKDPSTHLLVATTDVSHAFTPMARRTVHVMNAAPSPAATMMHHIKQQRSPPPISLVSPAALSEAAEIVETFRKAIDRTQQQSPCVTTHVPAGLRSISAPLTVRERRSLGRGMGHGLDITHFGSLSSGTEDRASAQRESSKAQLRLHQLLEEQHKIDTQRLLLPQGLLNC